MTHEVPFCGAGKVYRKSKHHFLLDEVHHSAAVPWNVYCMLGLSARRGVGSLNPLIDDSAGFSAPFMYA